jgi:mannosyltransferase
MLLVGGIGLTGPALGWDENATWSISRRSLGEIWHLAQNIDGVIAPYYVFQHFWTMVAGDSVVALRAPSLVAVALGVGLAGELGRRLVSPGAGLAAGLLLTAVPQLSRYAQDARAYGFAFLATVLATLLLYRALDRPSAGRWAAYAGAVALIGLSHLLGLLALAGHLVAVAVAWWPERDRRLLRWLPAAVAGALPAVPLAVLGLGQRGAQLDWIGAMTAGKAVAAPGTIFFAPAVGWLLIGVAWAARSPDRRVTAGLAALAVLPPALLVGVSFVTDPLWLPRYVLPVVVPVAVLAAAALRDRPWRTAALLAAVVMLGLPGQAEVRGPTAHVGLDFRVAARIVAAHQQPGDGMVFGRIGTWSLRAGMAYQLRHGPAPADVLLRRTPAEAGGLDGVECPSLSCFDSPRVWYIGQRRPGADPMQDSGIKLRRALETQYQQVSAWDIDHGTVRLYARR